MASDWQKDLQEKMGGRLKEQMDALHIKQPELAEKLDMSVGAVNKYVHGKARISREILDKLKTLGFDSFYIETGNIPSKADLLDEEIQSLKEENDKLKEEVQFCRRIIEQQSETLKNISKK